MSKDVNHLDTAVLIQEWQKNHHHDGSKPLDRSITARLCDGVLDVFHEAVRQLEQPRHAETATKPVRTSLERARGLIALWSDGYGIQDGRLDDVLAKSRNIRRSTLKTLSSIANTLLGRLIPLAQISSEKLDTLTARLTAAVDEASYVIHDVIHDERDDRSDTSSDGLSDVGLDDSINEVAEDLKTDAECLMELDPLFRDPVLDLALQKQKQNLEAIDWTPETVFCDKIQQRFPKAEATLVEKLGKANWARFLSCQEKRNYSAEIGTTSQANAAGDKDEDGTVAASSKYHDSGLGTSLPTASSYAETVMTYGAADGQKVRIPPLSDEAKKGAPFQCLACGIWVRITKNSRWKHHLYLDLEPYICLEPQCSDHRRFLTRTAWMAHLALQHGYDDLGWNAITCPLCFETTGKGKSTVTAHLARHLEEISLSALPAYPDEDDDDPFETGSDASPAEALEEADCKTLPDGDNGSMLRDDDKALRERKVPDEQIRLYDDEEEALMEALEEVDRQARLHDDDVTETIREALESADDEARREYYEEAAREARREAGETESLEEALEETDRDVSPDDVVTKEHAAMGEAGHLSDFQTWFLNQDNASMLAWERRMDEERARQEAHVGVSEDEIQQEITVDDHLRRLEAEAEYITSDEDDEDDDDSDGDEAETVVEDWDSRK